MSLLLDLTESTRLVTAEPLIFGGLNPFLRSDFEAAFILRFFVDGSSSPLADDGSFRFLDETDLEGIFTAV